MLSALLVLEALVFLAPLLSSLGMAPPIIFFFEYIDCKDPSEVVAADMAATGLSHCDSSGVRAPGALRRPKGGTSRQMSGLLRPVGDGLLAKAVARVQGRLRVSNGPGAVEALRAQCRQELAW